MAYFEILKKDEKSRARKGSVPMLTFASKLYPEVNLENTLIVGCQHLLISKYHLFKALMRKGLNPQNVHLIGKCYSTSESVLKRFQKLGVHISPYSTQFDSHSSFDDQFSDYIQHFLRGVAQKVESKKFDSVIVLDDGGLLIAMAHGVLNRTKNLVCIEQTSSGYQRLREMELKFPVLNIARSKAKLRLESPMVAEAVVSRMMHHLRKWEGVDKRILIVGQGPIGKSVYMALKGMYRVDRYDMVTHRNEFPGAFGKRLKQYDMIVAATGRTILRPGDFELLKTGVVLVSVSSSDREFSAPYIRGQFERSSNPHKTYVSKQGMLINAGFPINFTGKYYSVRLDKIQLTESLFVAGIMEAVSKTFQPGLHDLDIAIQNKLIRKFKQL